ncbi:MAG: YfcC family protein, partial [Bacteroidales bacterium]
VVAFQLGDGFTNMITPTSGVLLGVLTMAKIPYDKWFRWVLPLIVILFLLGFLLLLPTVFMQLKGF